MYGQAAGAVRQVRAILDNVAAQNLRDADPLESSYCM
jgi:hypothetical protein